MDVVFSPLALQDLEEIGDYIFSDNPHAAVLFVDKLRGRCMGLGTAPRSGVARPELGEGLRSVPFGAYVIFYSALPQEVRIERVSHGARDILVIFNPDE